MASGRWAASPVNGNSQNGNGQMGEPPSGQGAARFLMASPIPMAIPVASPTVPARQVQWSELQQQQLFRRRRFRTPSPADRICCAQWERSEVRGEGLRLHREGIYLSKNATAAR